MDRSKAETAAPILTAIKEIEAILLQLNTVILEGWALTKVQVTAPETGASAPAGTLIDLIPVGAVGQVLSVQGLQMAKDGYQQELAALNTTLNTL